ncbi:MAG: hypothetical protein ACLU23_01150 [Eubacterium sp.]|jgi:hypothetical protein
MKTNLKSKLNNKKSLIAAVLLFVFMLSICTGAYASSYNTTVKFKNPYEGSMRSFDGKNIKYSATMKSSKSKDTGTYEVILQKESGIWALDVGDWVKLKRVGSGSAKWSNCGKGKFRIAFYKSSDGVTLSSDNVVIANY